jgi:membrane-associated phospholipid phosphatase
VKATLRALVARRDEAAGRPPQIVFVLQAAYIAFLVIAFAASGIFLTPDILFLFLFLVFTWRGTRLVFIRDFAPFVLLLLSYEALRGYADDLGGRVHVMYPIAGDRAIFGEVPSVALQRWLYDPNQAAWYDYGAAFMHVLHFVAPLILAAVLWQNHKEVYWRFVVALLITSYAGFATYVLVPTAPPWFAGIGGLLDVHSVNDGLPGVSAVYEFLSPNPVAAMPSLHAAFPWLFLLFSARVWGVKGFVFLVYVVLMYLSLVYLGHHYVVDILAGMGYATVAYILCGTDLITSRLTALLRTAKGRLVSRPKTPVMSES